MNYSHTKSRYASPTVGVNSSARIIPLLEKFVQIIRNTAEPAVGVQNALHYERGFASGRFDVAFGYVVPIAEDGAANMGAWWVLASSLG